MSRDELITAMEAKYGDVSEVLLADGLEDAFVGLARVFSSTIAVYDTDKCIDIYVTRDGMTREDAAEFFEFNVVGAYAGKSTPAFIERLSEDGKVTSCQQPD